jgi:PEGA domain
MRYALRSLAVSLLISAAAAPVSAQTRSSPPAARASDAGAHFDRGATYYGEGDYPAALIEFKRAYETAPKWQVLFNIGQTYFQLRDYANALVTLQRFASEGGDRIDKEDRATLDTELPDLANRVGRVTVACNVEGATVSVDDQPVGTTPLRDPVLVSAGMRRVSATYGGRAPILTQASIGGGDNIVLHFDFPPPSRERPAPIRPVPKSPSYVPTYLSLLLGVGGLAVGSIFGVMAMGERSNLDSVCDPSKACPANYQPQIDSLNRDGYISTIAFGVGGAGVVLGVTLWLMARSGAGDSTLPATAASQTPPEPHLRFGPGVVWGSF